MAPAPRKGDSATARELLAEFALTQDEELLKRAQRLYPGDPRVILVSCLEAKTLDSPYLALMETLEPHNPLPSLMRAGMHAQAKDLDSFASELERLVGKDSLSTEVQERRRDMLEMLEARGAAEVTSEQVGKFDTNFFAKMNASVELLMATRDLYGDDESRTDETALSFAKLLKQSREFDMYYQARAGMMEYTILHRQGNKPGGEANAAERQQRMQQIMAEVEAHLTAGSQAATRIFAPGSDPALRWEFFVRLSHEGEAAAMDWLMKKTN